MSTNAVPMKVMIGEDGRKFPWPRRASIPHLIPAEQKLKEAISAIDSLPGDTTDIVIQLQKQQERLNDWVEANGLVKPE